MARTKAGAILTEQHRVSQLEVRRRALADYLRLWPIWEGDEDSFFRLVSAVITLIRLYRGISSEVAAGYFEAYRHAEGAPGTAAPQRAPEADESDLIGALIATGEQTLHQQLRAGKTPAEAKERTFVTTSGSVTRNVLQGGRETLLRSVQADRSALGWARVTDADPCAFCALLASRGPVYQKDTVDFEAHDHCSCTSEPVYSRDADWTPRSKEFKRMYNLAIGEAKEQGELRRGTSNDLLNAFRRYYDAQRP
jgi:hypothetical protein